MMSFQASAMAVVLISCWGGGWGMVFCHVFCLLQATRSFPFIGCVFRPCWVCPLWFSYC
jgi:hypothetical protein